MIARIPNEPEFRTQTIILVHRKELAEQAAKHCQAAYPDKLVEIEMGNNLASGQADITIASIRSLLSNDRIKKFDPARFKLVLVDEAHHIVAPSYRAILKYFDLEKFSDRSPALVGVSATFSRFDGLKIGTFIDQIVYHKDFLDMIGEKWLCDAFFTTVDFRADISKVGTGASGDFQTTELSAVVNTDISNGIAVRTWLSKAKERKSSLVFGVDVDHVKALTDEFRRRGIDARYLTGKTPKELRSRELDCFRKQEFPVLVNCGLFTEGTDIPNIDCIILARPTKSKNLLIQMIGRGLRLHPGKDNCHIIDMVASFEAGDVVTTPTLFGLQYDEGLDESGIDDIKTLKETANSEQSTSRSKGKELTEEQISVDFTEHTSLRGLLKEKPTEKYIRKLTNNAWVQVGDDRYVLTDRAGWLTISRDKDSDLFSVYHIRELPEEAGSPYSRPRMVATSLEFAQAVHAADTLANRIFIHVFISAWARWRKRKASLQQLNFLKRRFGDNNMLDLNKGQAADLITKFKHGAVGRLKKISTDMKRKQQKQAKEAAFRQREEVSVGPLES